jgi:cyanophycinase
MAEKSGSGIDKERSGLPVPKGKLLAIGGKEDKGVSDLKKEQEENIDFEKEEILKRFVEELKGNAPLVLVLPTASTVPEQISEDYKKAFHKLGVKNVKVLDIRTRKDAKDDRIFDLIKKAAGIMFTGGDQLRLSAILGGTKALELIKERYTYEEIIIAGTSAGAAAMSTPMIYEGETKGGYIKGDVRITTGLEFLKNVAIDTHFIQRGRIVRIAQAIATNPGSIGIGLEEDTAILITEGRNVEVIGSGLVTIVDGMDMSDSNIYAIETGQLFSIRDLKVHLLSPEQRYIIPTYEQLHT